MNVCLLAPTKDGLIDCLRRVQELACEESITVGPIDDLISRTGVILRGPDAEVVALARSVVEAQKKLGQKCIWIIESPALEEMTEKKVLNLLTETLEMLHA